MEKLVSVITPLYNNAEFLKDCINSVLNQEYQNWEMLIVDDCSTDDSYLLAQALSAKESRIKVFKMAKNSGSGLARNKAIQEAKGEYIAFLDSDDIWHPKKLIIQINEMELNNAVFSHTNYGYLSEENKFLEKEFRVSNFRVNYKDLLKRTEISCLTAVYNARVLGKIYMPDMRRKQDYALWLKILKSGNYSLPIPLKLAWYRQVNGSATSKKYTLIIKHICFLRETQGLNLIMAIYYTVLWILNGIKRYYL